MKFWMLKPTVTGYNGVLDYNITPRSEHSLWDKFKNCPAEGTGKKSSMAP